MSLITLPPEVVTDCVLPYLELEDLLSLRQACQLLEKWCQQVEALSSRRYVSYPAFLFPSVASTSLWPLCWTVEEAASCPTSCAYVGPVASWTLYCLRDVLEHQDKTVIVRRHRHKHTCHWLTRKLIDWHLMRFDSDIRCYYVVCSDIIPVEDSPGSREVAVVDERGHFYIPVGEPDVVLNPGLLIFALAFLIVELQEGVQEVATTWSFLTCVVMLLVYWIRS